MRGLLLTLTLDSYAAETSLVMGAWTFRSRGALAPNGRSSFRFPIQVWREASVANNPATAPSPQRVESGHERPRLAKHFELSAPNASLRAVDKPKPFMLRERSPLRLDEVEVDQRRLRRALAHIKKLLADAQELIDRQR